jgi:hypothetical protein
LTPVCSNKMGLRYQTASPITALLNNSQIHGNVL